MFHNYLVTALNNLARNRLYAAITILGLAVAFAVAILVGQFVRNEFSYDRWLPGHDHVYKLVSLVEPAGQKPITIDATAGLANRLRTASPAVTVARLSGNSALVRRGQRLSRRSNGPIRTSSGSCPCRCWRGPWPVRWISRTAWC